jgi:hypothetical protein
VALQQGLSRTGFAIMPPLLFRRWLKPARCKRKLTLALEALEDRYTPANQPPLAPLVSEPPANVLISPFDTQMVAAFSDPDVGDTHTATDWELWTVAAAPQRVWFAHEVTDAAMMSHIELDDGAFDGPLAGRGELDHNTGYELRVRMRDSSSDAATQWGPFATQRFHTEPIDFAAGFATGTTGVLTINGNAAAVGNVLRLTHGQINQKGSVFSTAKVRIDAFVTSFRFQLHSGPTRADGITFTIQGQSPGALGGLGRELGYSGIGDSFAVKFDLLDNAGEGDSSTGFYLDGALPTVPAIDLLSASIDLHQGHVMQVDIEYDQGLLHLLVTDTVTGARLQRQFNVNLPAVVGASAAYVGFTGATGDLVAVQDILNWSFEAFTPGSPPRAPAGLDVKAPINTGQPQLQLSWRPSLRATSYTIFRYADPAGPGTLIADGVTTTSYTDSGVSFGMPAWYRVAAVSSQGASALSEAAGATPRLHVRINMTTPRGEAVPGWLADTGGRYGPRADGLFFGWKTNNPRQGQDRDARNSPSELHDSFHKLQTNNAAAVWRIAVPNGRYQVRILVGDPRSADGVHKIKVQGKLAINFKPSPKRRWLERTVTVTVKNGRLTITGAADAVGAKLNAVELIQM